MAPTTGGKPRGLSGAVPSCLVNSPSTNPLPGTAGNVGEIPTMLRGDEFVARVRAWPCAPGVVQLVTLDQSAPPVEVVQRWVDELAQLGTHTVRTGALGPALVGPRSEEHTSELQSH